jgi:hypothetical protein
MLEKMAEKKCAELLRLYKIAYIHFYRTGKNSAACTNIKHDFCLIYDLLHNAGIAEKMGNLVIDETSKQIRDEVDAAVQQMTFNVD